jgi:hypothetical protein
LLAVDFPRFGRHLALFAPELFAQFEQKEMAKILKANNNASQNYITAHYQRAKKTPTQGDENRGKMPYCLRLPLREERSGKVANV